MFVVMFLVSSLFDLFKFALSRLLNYTHLSDMSAAHELSLDCLMLGDDPGEMFRV